MLRGYVRNRHHILCDVHAGDVQHEAVCPVGVGIGHPAGNGNGDFLLGRARSAAVQQPDEFIVEDKASRGRHLYVDFVRKDERQREVEHARAVGRVIGRDGLAVIAQRPIEEVCALPGLRVFHVYDKLGEKEGLCLRVRGVCVLDGQIKSVILMSALRDRAVCGVFQKLVYVREIGVIINLPATEGHASDFERFFHRHTRRHDRPPVGGWFVAVFHDLFPLCWW